MKGTTYQSSFCKNRSASRRAASGLPNGFNSSLSPSASCKDWLRFNDVLALVGELSLTELGLDVTGEGDVLEDKDDVENPIVDECSWSYWQ